MLLVCDLLLVVILCLSGVLALLLLFMGIVHYRFVPFCLLFSIVGGVLCWLYLLLLFGDFIVDEFGISTRVCICGLL